MKKYISINRSGPALLWQLGAIVVCVAWESGSSILRADALNLKLYIVFYALDISYILFAFNLYLPTIYSLYSITIRRIGLILLLLLSYIVLLCIVSAILHSLIKREFILEITFQDFQRSSNRAILLTGIVFGLWHFKYKLIQERKIRDQDKKILEMRYDNLKLENDMLRSQINVHFLFNYLTTLHRNYVERYPEASESILLLADVMEYGLIQSGKTGKVNLKHDLIALGKVIILTQQLSRNRLQLNYSCDIDDNQSFEIVPLILLPLIENVFKHGDLSNPDDPGIIKIAVEEGHLKYHSLNKILKEDDLPSHNVGVENINRRLQNHYPNRHNLLIEERNHYYEVNLTIQL